MDITVPEVFVYRIYEFYEFYEFYEYILSCVSVTRTRGLLKFESRVSSIKTRVSSSRHGRIRCFLLIQLKLETRVLILETGYSIQHNTTRTNTATSRQRSCSEMFSVNNYNTILLYIFSLLLSKHTDTVTQHNVLFSLLLPFHR